MYSVITCMVYILEVSGNQKVVATIDFQKNVKISSFVFCNRNKVVHIWNDVSK